MSAQKASSMAELMASHGSQVRGLQKGDEVEGTVKKLTFTIHNFKIFI